MLGDISVADFLRDYWQKKPLLIRNAIPGFQSPLEPDEIAGLALEEEIESRIVLEDFQGSPWQLRCGPFAEDAFSHLPEKNWTLLVQALDHYIPEVSELLQHFRFIPSWRLDDIMVSYAVDGGSVGPHYDHYDVFLLQGQGQRHWQLGQQCDEHSATLSGTPLNILKDFDCQEQWTVNPGDMLYLPPKFAHWGVAKGECVTYSIGFRAPSVSQLIEEHTLSINENLSEFNRYSDHGLSLRKNHAEILPEDLQRVDSLLQQALSPMDPQTNLAYWFGRSMTEAKYSNDAPIEEDEVEPEVGMLLERSASARLAFYKLDEQSALLFVNGKDFNTELSFAEIFCKNNVWEVSPGDDINVIKHCINQDIYWILES